MQASRTGPYGWPLPFIYAYNYVEDPQMIQLLIYVDIAVGNSAFSSFN